MAILGDGAYRFVEWLERAGQRVWQVLPLGPTGYGDSPYQSFSTFAGNWLLVSPERLVADGLLRKSAIADVPAFPADKVDFGWAIGWKRGLLQQAADAFFANAKHSDHGVFETFCRENDAWSGPVEKTISQSPASPVLERQSAEPASCDAGA